MFIFEIYLSECFSSFYLILWNFPGFLDKAMGSNNQSPGFVIPKSQQSVGDALISRAEFPDVIIEFLKQSLIHKVTAFGYVVGNFVLNLFGQRFKIA